MSPLQGSFQSIGVNKMILWVHYRRIFFGVGVALAGLFYVLPPINYFVVFMGLRWLVLRRGLTESAIIRIFAKI